MHGAARQGLSRILIGPTEVAGLGQGLQEGLASLGVDAELVLESQHPFHYAAREARSPLVQAWQWAGTRARSIPMRHLPLKALAYAAHRLLGWPVLLWALLRYDAFVLLYGKTLTNTRVDLWLMRSLRKPAVVIFVGSDARPAYINGAWPASSAAALRRRVRRQKRRLRWLERLAAACVNAPGTAHFHERPFINWFAMGCARSVAAVAQPAPPADAGPPGRPLRVVHSPSVPRVKGSALIEAAVQRLRQRGFVMDFIVLKGMANQQVLATLRHCDLVVDQLYSDTPMAGLATEAAQFGKPVLVAGYFARGMPQALGGMPVPPTCFVAPEDFERSLEHLLTDTTARAELGAAALRFVQAEWSCRQVAARLLRILHGDVPAEWWFDPENVDYLAGCGLSEDAARERVRQLIDHAGSGALQLADKPLLQAAFERWAREPGADAAVCRGAAP